MSRAIDARVEWMNRVMETSATEAPTQRTDRTKEPMALQTHITRNQVFDMGEPLDGLSRC
eukprot:1634294-Alexandrium_andersonii.AAC.1